MNIGLINGDKTRYPNHGKAFFVENILIIKNLNDMNFKEKHKLVISIYKHVWYDDNLNVFIDKYNIGDFVIIMNHYNISLKKLDAYNCGRFIIIKNFNKILKELGITDNEIFEMFEI
jgi:hypothetical protein